MERSGSLSRTFAGLSWFGLVTIATKALDFGSAFVLAKVLAPEDFGILTMALICIGVLGIVADLGIPAALIHKRDMDERTANTAFLLHVGAGLLLFALIWLMSPFIGAFLGNPRIDTLLRGSSPLVPLASAALVPTALLLRRLEFKTVARVELAVAPVNPIVTVVLALAGFGVWSVVVGLVLSSSIRLIVWFRAARWLPGLRVSGRATRDLLAYGKNLTAQYMMGFIATNVDNAVVYGAVGASGLGFYSFAYNNAYLPVTTISLVASRAIFPLFSQYQRDGDALRQSYLSTVRLVSFLVFPIYIAMAMLGRDALALLFGEKWLPAVLALQILCLGSLLRSIAALADEVFKALGTTDRLLWFACFQAGLALALLFPLAASYGIEGASVAMTVATTLTAVWFTDTVLRRLGVARSSLLSVMSPQLAGGLAMIAAIKVAQLAVDPASPALYVATAAVLGFASYLGCLFILDRPLIEALAAFALGRPHHYTADQRGIRAIDSNHTP